jgi:hypothetical protein
VRSQRKKCGMSEKLHAVVQQNNRPFVEVAAWIRRRIYELRTKRAFAASASMTATDLVKPNHIPYVTSLTSSAMRQ